MHKSIQGLYVKGTFLLIWMSSRDEVGSLPPYPGIADLSSCRGQESGVLRLCVCRAALYHNRSVTV